MLQNPEIALKFYERVEEHLQHIAGLQEDIDHVRTAVGTAQREAAELLKDTLSPGDRVAIGALLRASADRTTMAAERELLWELDRTIRSAQGEPVLWLAEEKEKIVSHPSKPEHYKMVEYLNMGILTDDAGLGVAASGSLIIPLRNRAQVPVSRFIGADNGYRWPTKEAVFKTPGKTDLKISSHKSPTELRLVIGSKKTDEALARMDSPELNELRNNLLAMGTETTATQ